METKKYKKTIIQFEKITSNEKSVFIHHGSIMIAVSKAYLKKVLSDSKQTDPSRDNDDFKNEVA